jgi:hypothetical protein
MMVVMKKSLRSHSSFLSTELMGNIQRAKYERDSNESMRDRHEKLT